MKKLVNILFKMGINFREIRLHLFQIPHKFPRLSQLRKQDGFEELTKEGHRALASDFYLEKKFYDLILLHHLDCASYDDLKKKKKSRYSAKQQKERGGYSWTKRKKEARERDGNKCVITGDTKPLFVHHINGDKTDNRLENLVTIARRVNDAIHHGARDFHPEDLEHWKQEDSEYVEKIDNRHKLLKEYVKWLQTHGFPNACLESLPLSELASDSWKTGANKDIHFSMYHKRRFRNHYWIPLLEPSGLTFEKISFEESYKQRYGRSYTAYEDEEEMFEDFPRTPGDDQNCLSCRFKGTKECPFDTDEFEKGETSLCSKWQKITQ